MTFQICPQTGAVPAMNWLRIFDGCPRQAREVRRFVSALLPGFSRLDDVLLATDELVVNTLRHTKSGQAGGTFTVQVTRCADAVAISVADEGGPGEPAAVCAGDFDECGRGLRTVSLLATAWGWYGNGAGRTVHATFSTGTASWSETTWEGGRTPLPPRRAPGKPAQAVDGEDGGAATGRRLQRWRMGSVA